MEQSFRFLSRVFTKTNAANYCTHAVKTTKYNSRNQKIELKITIKNETEKEIQNNKGRVY